jgi:hypothetical protein
MCDMYVKEPMVNAMLTWPFGFFFGKQIISTRLQRLFQTRDCVSDYTFYGLRGFA